MEFERKDILASLFLFVLTWTFVTCGFDVDLSALFFHALREDDGRIFLFSRELRQFRLPLSVFFDDPHAGLFYPFRIFYFFGRPEFVFRLTAAIHLFFAGFFTYLLSRRFGMRPLAAIFSALAFALSGPIFSRLDMPGANGGLAGVIWIPLVLVFFHFTFTQREARLAALTGAFLSALFLSGDLSMFFCCIVLLILWSIFVVPWDGSAMKLWMYLVGFFLGLAAISLMPLAVFVARQREGIHFADLFPMGESFQTWATILKTAFPMASGKYYLGVLPLCLMSFAYFFKHRREVSTFGGLFALSWGLTFLGATHALVLASFSVAMLGGFGFEWLLKVAQETPSDSNERQILFRLSSGMMAFGALALCVGLFFYSRGAYITTFYSFMRGVVFSSMLFIACGFLVRKRLSLEGRETFFESLVVILVIWEFFQVGSRDLSAHAMAAPLPWQKYRYATAMPTANAWMEAKESGPTRTTALTSPASFTPVTVDWDQYGWMVSSSYSGRMVVDMAYHPEWSVFMNREKREPYAIRSDDGATRMAVDVEAGQGEVHFCFRPQSFRYGKWVSFTSLVALLIYLLHPFSWKRLAQAFSISGGKRE